MVRIKNPHRRSSAKLLALIRARLGLYVRPCDLQKIIRPGDNAYALLDRLVANRFAVRSHTIDVGKGRVLYTLAEDLRRLGPFPRPVYVKRRWRVSIAFVPGWPLTRAVSTLKPGTGKVASVRFRRQAHGRVYQETMTVHYLGTLPDGGWLVRLEESPCPTSPRRRRKKSRRSRSGTATRSRSSSPPILKRPTSTIC